MVVLRTVQGEGDGNDVFVPHLSVTAAVALTLLSVAMLIYYVHHIAMSMQVSEITAGVAHDLERTIDRLYPDRFGEGADGPDDPPPAVPRDANDVAAPRSGYIQEIDADRVLALAGEHETTIWLTARPGDFVVEGTPIAAVHPPPLNRRAFDRALTDAYLLASDRTSYQDIGFAVQQLVELALRALSPSLNEPFTATTCVDRLGQGLSKLAARKVPDAVRTDGKGRVRVIARPQTFDALVEAAFEPIARHAGGDPVIVGRLLSTLDMLASAARRPADRAALARVADAARRSAQDVDDERRRAHLMAQYDRVRQKTGTTAGPLRRGASAT